MELSTIMAMNKERTKGLSISHNQKIEREENERRNLFLQQQLQYLIYYVIVQTAPEDFIATSNRDLIVYSCVEWSNHYVMHLHISCFELKKDDLLLKEECWNGVIDGINNAQSSNAGWNSRGCPGGNG